MPVPAPAPLKIAITGGDGHVGTALVHLALSDGHTVVALDRSPDPSFQPPMLQGDLYTYKRLDLLDYPAFKAAVQGCDALVHLAAIYNKHDGHGNLSEEAPQHVRPTSAFLLLSSHPLSRMMS